MNQITHEDFGSFQTELLQVDFITFNLTKLSNIQISQLATYFQNLGFNCYLKKAELTQIKQERQEKEIRKQARASRKRLPKRDPMTRQSYKELIKAAEGPTYINLRT